MDFTSTVFPSTRTAVFPLTGTPLTARSRSASISLPENERPRLVMSAFAHFDVTVLSTRRTVSTGISPPPPPSKLSWEICSARASASVVTPPTETTLSFGDFERRDMRLSLTSRKPAEKRGFPSFTRLIFPVVNPFMGLPDMPSTVRSAPSISFTALVASRTTRSPAKSMLAPMRTSPARPTTRNSPIIFFFPMVSEPPFLPPGTGVRVRISEHDIFPF